MREAAELLTYEVADVDEPALRGAFAGTLNLAEIVQAQTTTWAILPLFPAFVLFFVTSLAETNRPPSTAGAGNELMGGFVVGVQRSALRALLRGGVTPTSSSSAPR